jgi:predicted phosphodiesterase
MRFHLLSDLHLEHGETFALDSAPPDTPFLILAGDIGNPRSESYMSFVRRASELYQRVFLVAGNHEFYGSSLSATRAIIRAFCESLPNVTFLDRSWYDASDGVRVVGCTLWSNVQPAQAASVVSRVGDFRRIRWWCLEACAEEHAADVAFLRAQVDRASRVGASLVVVTHHAPLLEGTHHPKHDGSPVSSAFASDLSELVKPPVALWVYGHTHHNARQTLQGNTRLACNQLGYNDKDERKDFDPTWCEKI